LIATQSTANPSRIVLAEATGRRDVRVVTGSLLSGQPYDHPMSRFAQTERQALCDLALELGPDEPTLSGDWSVKDLVVHLLLREGSPAAAGIVVKPLAPLTDRATQRLARRDLSELVERLRQGPPAWSPFRLPLLDRTLNTLEFFVHHEDIRRARPSWEPRDLDVRVQDGLWRMIRFAGQGLARPAPVGVVLERTDTGEQAVLKKAGSSVVVRGLPAELVLFVYGRKQQARVELVGAEADRSALSGADLGI
jgi:uncharacterized protein (TIGR03085 family)